MPKQNGLFDSFENLDQINPESLQAWIKNPPDIDYLENYLANKLLYPNSVSITQEDIKIDLAILREALALNPAKSPFLNTTLKKIIIPQSFLLSIPNLVNLSWAFLDGLLQKRTANGFNQDIFTIVLKSEVEKIIGSVLIAEFEGVKDSMNLNISAVNYKVKPGSLILIPSSKSKEIIEYSLFKGKLLGKNTGSIEIFGGELGILVDGRRY